MAKEDVAELEFSVSNVEILIEIAESIKFAENLDSDKLKKFKLLNFTQSKKYLFTFKLAMLLSVL